MCSTMAPEASQPDALLHACLALSRQARTQRGAALARTLDRLDAALRGLAGPAAPAAPDEAVIELDLAGYLCGWNGAAERLFGYTREEALGQHILFLYADDDDDGKIAELFADAGGAGEVRRRKKSGAVFWLRLTRTPIVDAAGDCAGMAVRLSVPREPLSEQDKVRLHARIVEDSDQGVLITDADERIVSVNGAFTRITGYAPAEAIGQTPDLLRTGRHDADLRARVRAAMTAREPWRGEIVGRRKNGELFPQSLTISAVRDEAGRLSHTFSLLSDISVHKDAEARMQRMANYDSLTGLPNRFQLNQLMTQALAGARRSAGHGALLVLDIGRIGAIGDTLGAETADQLLVAIGRLLRAALRDADILARVEGHKFVAALLGIDKREHAAIVAHKLLAALAAPILVDAHSLQVGARIGISVYPEDGLDVASLFRYADVAAAKAQQQTEPGYLFYREEMNQRAKEHLRLESELRQALAARQLQLHYQPKVSLRSGRIVGAEALLRWQHPLRGMVSPGVFIPVAEESGLVLELGGWVLDEACRQIGAWRDAGVAMPTIAVNLSARQFDGQLPARIAAALDRHGVLPQQIMLEITESLLVRGAEQVIAIMNELVAMGLALALDDFGTGYSSLAYLKKFPISTLKIDRSFVVGLPQEENDCAIARAIVTMAQQLRQEIVAEGVETVEQMRFLRGLGCDQLQGYLFSPAVPAADFAQMLREGRRLSFAA
ncbi:putative bifunctional diguanylate cyclase/phosphodiesterase [Janthinobacterium fluminis]|uniref:EAL domain-containing protein n=1 Tax=Janthinobacterium fluminis TaxID=2987524 RepID=A0ABT5JVB8_9BURK|nr:EAL domain-containing protein [Janthinobacterium fluminis]MDC8756103.1 EAL domain-containing protein [Janthinobacterium fluminis]